MRLTPLLATPLLALGLLAAPGPSGAAQLAHPSVSTRTAVPALSVRPIVRGLDHPWDVRALPGGRLIYTQRERATLSVWRAGRSHRLQFPSKAVWVSGETGLMGLEVDPDFTRNRRVYTCQGGFSSRGHVVRVVAYTIDTGFTKATPVKILVGGFPTSTGRHGGCRLLITRNGSMLVGTGDAAQSRNPRDLTSLGGKTLRLNRITGAPWPTNEFVRSPNRQKRYVQTYGHRNVQGLAQRRDGSLWSIEQGSYRDDEVNKLVNGGDYGWNPGPGYDESVPMTDFSLPGKQYGAKWSSGDPTLAACGGTFVDGKQWGALDGALAVAFLKASRVVFFSFDASGKLTAVRTPAELRRYGRIRQVTQAPNGTLLVTTDNGGGDDVILRVTPSAG